MRRTRAFFLLGMSLWLAGCSQKPPADDGLQAISLPDGRQIRVEVMTRAGDLMRGMMFRDSLAPDRGMLFVHTAAGRYPYWMFQVRIPLDIIWLDARRRIVEISPNTPPCQAQARDCPNYGGHADALYVLELAGGMASNCGLKPGDVLRF